VRWGPNYADPAQADYMEVRCGELSIWTNNPPMRAHLYQRIRDPRRTVIDNYTIALAVEDVLPGFTSSSDQDWLWMEFRPRPRCCWGPAVQGRPGPGGPPTTEEERAAGEGGPGAGLKVPQPGGHRCGRPPAGSDQRGVGQPGRFTGRPCDPLRGFGLGLRRFRGGGVNTGSIRRVRQVDARRWVSSGGALLRS